ncbi:hypothetical protein Efla_005855 [Eimeria flavescens]
MYELQHRQHSMQPGPKKGAGQQQQREASITTATTATPPGFRGNKQNSMSIGIIMKPRSLLGELTWASFAACIHPKIWHNGSHWDSMHRRWMQIHLEAGHAPAAYLSLLEVLALFAERQSAAAASDAQQWKSSSEANTGTKNSRQQQQQELLMQRQSFSDSNKITADCSNRVIG